MTLQSIESISCDKLTSEEIAVTVQKTPKLVLFGNVSLSVFLFSVFFRSTADIAERCKRYK
jgi:hypothetical protein